MYFTYQEIKELMTTEYDTLTEDTLSEIADSVTPVYYNEIIKDWAEMPSEFDDTWKVQGGHSQQAGILQLMALDLYFYNLNRVTEIYAKLQEESEAAE